eukprot:CAMPEP_0171769172 /NCGR_PEP_ID=MMETSP0991-20121206/52802_1 /TAXON_ID=483369 /ORGANISM="non described non described, Strain CCMP2098" /LENGTH=189 /DNA_ID=CAMNT_0012374193 /DNA_START=220 /DNA_END=789 /DNA_ORIENTATION=+
MPPSPTSLQPALAIPTSRTRRRCGSGCASGGKQRGTLGFVSHAVRERVAFRVLEARAGGQEVDAETPARPGGACVDARAVPQPAVVDGAAPRPHLHRRHHRAGGVALEVAVASAVNFPRTVLGRRRRSSPLPLLRPFTLVCQLDVEVFAKGVAHEPAVVLHLGCEELLGATMVPPASLAFFIFFLEPLV